ncbi:fumarylacetoacetase [Siccirubricoccus deserti]|uniref:fumarylacetoacetase n=1 Tax=Siccirubricoccus deserti TaxID=2013562 RepID=A0A9X0QWF9_9PROT|nr:fumarylacetoacetase [Siccirubricoccus deserti]MBC4015109.1 fumarylacetoacetase [Siccirubricoccus deserti]GGC38865.1 fumarylacetoacetase [Siccirubricoccus deserti]
MDRTHDPKLTSFVASANGHDDFPIQNLPFGIFSPPGGKPRGGVAIGDSILDLGAVAPLLAGEARRAAEAAAGDALNPLFALGAGPRRALRAALSALLAADSAKDAEVRPHLHDAAGCTLHLPARIGDYTDFFAGIHHAANAGKQFRPDNPLLPNYKYVPVAYHGRASSVRPSGTPVRRPKGQRKPPAEAAPSFGPCRNLDYEMEFGIWIGPGNAQGEPIPIAEAAGHIAGFSLLNDWSARDIQSWEAQPLGPFLAKNFCTSVSPWVVTPEALEPFRIAQPKRPEGDPAPMAYLLDPADQAGGALDLAVEVLLQTPKGGPFRLSLANTSHLYWTFAQMVAHHTIGGCNLAPGDLFGSGTISAPSEDGYGALLEITYGGRKPVRLPNGEERSFLEDGETVILRARATREGCVPIGFGECRGTVLPAT